MRDIIKSKESLAIAAAQREFMSDWVCPKCKSKNVNNKSFDFINFCKDCNYEWEK